MLFNSIEFLVFFPIVTLLYYLFPHKFRWTILLLASCVFYAAFIPSYLLILLLLILIDYFAGILIENTIHKRSWLFVSIIANLTLLGIFKYYNFFIENINALSGTDLILVHWVLPIGLSFHTFQSLSYTIEVYKGKQKAVKHLGYYALYVMFYPQLVAGPIERPQNLFPQFYAKHKFSFQNLFEGLRLITWGFFKKVVIADRLGMYADMVFNDPAQANSHAIILAVLFFSIQIYADFSGYSDIALGCAKCMGINLMVNFNRPYFAKNIRDFWNRWHISLSTWFKDYVYIPLGGNKLGFARTNFNLLVTFLLSGFWHGASWTFVIWGLLHGLYIILFRTFQRFSVNKKIFNWLSWLITIVAVGFAWIFFRADSLNNAFVIIQKAFSIEGLLNGNILDVKDIQFGNFSLLLTIALLTYLFVVEKLTVPKLTNLNNKNLIDIVFITITVLLIVFFGVFNKSSFIYFQF